MLESKEGTYCLPIVAPPLVCAPLDILSRKQKLKQKWQRIEDTSLVLSAKNQGRYTIADDELE